MTNVNPIVAQDVDFSKLLFELEQINLRLLVELKQQQRLKRGTGNVRILNAKPIAKSE